jgi:hypothetical protein
MGPQEKQSNAAQAGRGQDQASTPTSDRTTRVLGTEVTLRDFGVQPNGEATASGIWFARDVRKSIVTSVGDAKDLTVNPFGIQANLSGSASLPLDDLLNNLGVKRISGSVDVRGIGGGTAASQSPSSPFGQLFASGDAFKYSAGVSQSGVSMGYAGVGMEEFSQWLSNGRMKFSEATIRYNGEDFVVTPTFTIQQIPGFSFSPTTSIDSVFQAIEGQSPLYDHILSGDPNNPSAGLPLEGHRLFMNSYSFSEQPGASVIKLDLTRNDNLFKQSVLLGHEPSVGNFLGVRSIFDAYEQNGVFTSGDGIASLMPQEKQRVAHYHILGDLLYAQQSDGTHSVGGSAKFNYEKGKEAFSINLKLDRELDNFLRGSDGGLDKPDWSGSIFIEFRR